jgi:hypothetical protein
MGSNPCLEACLDAKWGYQGVDFCPIRGTARATIRGFELCAGHLGACWRVTLLRSRANLKENAWRNLNSEFSGSFDTR